MGRPCYTTPALRDHSLACKVSRAECLSVCLHLCIVYRTDANPPPLNSLTFRPVVGQLSEVVPFLLLQQRCGMACQAMLRRPRRCRCSRTGWRQTSSAAAMKPFNFNDISFPGHYLSLQNNGPCNSFYCLGHFKNVYDDDVMQKKHTTNHKFKLPGTNNCNREESVFQRWRPWDQGIPIKCIKATVKFCTWWASLPQTLQLTDRLYRQMQFKLHVLPFSGYCIVVRNLLSRLILWSKKWFLHTNSICAIVSTANTVFTAGTNSWQYLSTDGGLVQ